MRVAAIHQPNYLPWLGYFYKVINCDVFVFLDSVQYTKNSFINRNKIKTPQGAIWLTVGVLSKGKYGQLISETKINNDISWSKNHWKSVSQAYSRAPYFDNYEKYLAGIYQKHWEYLADLNETLIKANCDMLAITNVQFIKASDLNVSGTGTELLINICKEVEADTYLSGFGGVKYMEEDKFRESGIELKYYSFEHPVYHQLWGDFIPNLAIIDLLFNEGERSLQILKESTSPGS